METQEIGRVLAHDERTAEAMAKRAASDGREALERGQPLGGGRFDWAISMLSGVFLGGLFLDGWAHAHGRVDESFFTPWHAVFYSGFLAVAAYLVVALIRNRVRGYPWRRALPAGYGLSLVGVLIFALGGMGDMLWHELFGIEGDVEALLSPTHLILALGLGLIVSGPLRAQWSRGGPRHSRVAGLPMLLSLAFILSLFTFFTMYSHASVELWAAASHTRSSPAPGITGILLQTAVLMGVLLLLVRHWTLPLGGLTLVFTLNAVAMGFLHMHDGYRLIPVVAAAASGLVADLLLHRLRPTARRLGVLRLFAFAVPAVFYLFYFLALMLTEGIWWSIHAWTGSIVLAGVAGWLLSYLVVPPGSQEVAHANL